MKCPYCGSPIDLEDEFCSFCGQRNTLAQKHQTDMRHYKNEFTKTQQEVYKKTRHFASLTVPIIILFVLLVLNIGAVIFARSSWDIGKYMLEHKIQKNADEHREQLETYIKAGDYYGFSAYYNTNSLYMADEFREYNAVVSAADSYFRIYEILLNTSEYGNYHLDQENISSTVRSITYCLTEIFDVEHNYSYNKELYLADDKMAVIYTIQDQTKAILAAYGGLTLEEAENLPNLSATRQQELLERRLKEL